jgi:hypothetical protein
MVEAMVVAKSISRQSEQQRSNAAGDGKRASD